MNPVIGHPFKVGFSDSMSLVLLCGGLVMLVAFLILLLMPKVELRTSSASAAARAESNAASGRGAGRRWARTGRRSRRSVGDLDGHARRAADLPEPEGRHAGPTATEETADPR